MSATASNAFTEDKLSVLPAAAMENGRSVGEQHLVRELWRAMVQIRTVEEFIAGRIEAGEVGCPCHLAVGQEATAVGICSVLRADDTVWGNHRSHGHYLAKGGSLVALLRDIAGLGRGGSMHISDPEHGLPGTVPIVAGSVPLAIGAAMAYKLRGEDRVSVVFFGDGAMEEGVVHESFNLAAIHALPVVFVCENNGYSSHLHWSERRKLDNLDRAGELHGVPGFRVDGNDVLSVRATASRAVEHARSGGGPSLMECRTLRVLGHVGPSRDLDVGITRRADLADWISLDPIARVEGFFGPSTDLDIDRRTLYLDVEAAWAAVQVDRGRCSGTRDFPCVN